MKHFSISSVLSLIKLVQRTCFFVVFHCDVGSWIHQKYGCHSPETYASMYFLCFILFDLRQFQNKALCVHKGHLDYECHCPAQYYGRNCERRNPCVLDPCSNSGICTNLTDTEFSCSCSSNYRLVR